MGRQRFTAGPARHADASRSWQPSPVIQCAGECASLIVSFGDASLGIERGFIE
jgi:hypothetical protein